MDDDLLDVLLDSVTDRRLKLISEDEARAEMVLLWLLDDAGQPEEIRQRVALPKRRSLGK